MTRTAPSRRANRRRRGRSPIASALTGLTVFAALCALGYLALSSSSSPSLLGFKTLYAVVPDPGNLRPHNAVRVSGVRVGQVTSVESRKTGGARITFKLDRGEQPLPADSAVVVRAQGLLGARFLEVVPGRSARPASEGATLRGGKDSLTFGVPDALDTFDDQTRGAFGAMLRQLGRGFAARGERLNDTIAAMPRAERRFAHLARRLLARGAARRLVPSLDSMAAALAAARDDLAGAMAPAARGLRPFADQRARLERAIDRAPSTLRAANAGLADGRVLLSGADALAVAARRTLRRAPAALRETTALLRESHVPLQRATRLLGDVPSTVPAVLRLTRALDPELAQLTDGARNAIPILGQLGVHGCDVENVADNWRSLLNIGVPGGGELGGLTSFRIAGMGGASIALGKSLEPLMVDDFHMDTYPSACRYSPGSRYELLSTDAPEGGGR